MRILHIRLGGRIRWCDVASIFLVVGMLFCGVSCQKDDTFTDHLDTRWTRFARSEYDPSHQHVLKNVRVVHVVGAFSDDRNLLGYSARSSYPYENLAIRVMEVESGQAVTTLEGHWGSTQCIAFTRDGHNLVSGGERYIKFWDITESRQISRADAHQGYIRCIACSPVSDMAASGGQDGSILVWNLKPLRVSQRLLGHSGGVRCLTWSSDGSSILSGSWDGSIRLWDLSDGSSRFTAQAGYGRVMSLDLTRDGRFAMSSYLNGVILWDIEKEQEINRFAVPGNPWHADQSLHIASVAFSPDGETALFGAVFGSVIWWDVRNWRQIDHNLVHKKELTDVVFSADGEQAISVGGDGEMVTQVSVWTLPEYHAENEKPEGDEQRDKRDTANTDEH
ncbi:MAG: WD40 repeat domain-containing protein [Planctomycetota bacterium]